MIKFSPPDITEKEREAVCNVLRSGWITTGEKTAEFENKISQQTGCPKAVCLSSATAALEMVLRRLEIGVGDEVILPAYTYTATAAAVLHTGAVPVMADTQAAGYHIDPEEIARRLTSRTAAVIAVDIGGVMCDYDAIREILEQAGGKKNESRELLRLFGRPILIADAAHSFGSVYRNRKSGMAADFSCFSCHAVKNLTSAEGGCIVWQKKEGLDDERLYCEFRTMSLHGQTKDAKTKAESGNWEYDIVYPGWKCNMTDVHAAIGAAQLERYSGMLEKKKKICEIYDGVFEGKLGRLRHGGADFESNRHLYMINLTGMCEKTEERRNRLAERLFGKGICCNVHFKPLPLLTAYRSLGYTMETLPHSLQSYEGELTLPLHTQLSEQEAYYVAETVCRELYR